MRRRKLPFQQKYIPGSIHPQLWSTILFLVGFQEVYTIKLLLHEWMFELEPQKILLAQNQLILNILHGLLISSEVLDLDAGFGVHDKMLLLSIIAINNSAKKFINHVKDAQMGKFHRVSYSYRIFICKNILNKYSFNLNQD